MCRILSPAYCHNLSLTWKKLIFPVIRIPCDIDISGKRFLPRILYIVPDDCRFLLYTAVTEEPVQNVLIVPECFYLFQPELSGSRVMYCSLAGDLLLHKAIKDCSIVSATASGASDLFPS